MEHALARVDQLMERALKDGAFPGAVLAVGSSEHAAIRTYGVTTPLEGGAPVTEETIYDLASLSKLFTATAALMLLERGEFRLDDPVSRFLPSFAQGDKAEIRLRHLLTHTSGLPAFNPYYETVKGQAEMLNAIAQTPLQYKTGSQVIYSCLGFITLANVIQTIAGQSLDSFLASNLFASLAMADTGYGPVGQPRERIAPTEECPWRGRVAWGEVHDENAFAQGGVSGNAGLFSTAPDLVRFAQMMLRNGASSGGRLLSPAVIRAATRNYTSGLQENRGLGWQMRSNEYPWCGDLAPANSYGHTGFTGTSLWISSDDDLFVVLLTNRVHPKRANVQHIRYRPLIHNLLISELGRA
ncbi:MAG: serine hydrolase domain-containing protein [Bacillota bacterium]